MKKIVVILFALFSINAFTQKNEPKVSGLHIMDDVLFTSPFVVIKHNKEVRFQYKEVFKVKSEIMITIGKGKSNEVIITSESKDIGFALNVEEIQYDNKNTITKLICFPMGNTSAVPFYVTNYHLQGRIDVTNYIKGYELSFYYYDSSGIGTRN